MTLQMSAILLLQLILDPYIVAKRVIKGLMDTNGHGTVLNIGSCLSQAIALPTVSQTLIYKYKCHSHLFISFLPTVPTTWDSNPAVCGLTWCRKLPRYERMRSSKIKLIEIAIYLTF